jgi:hypothetical protein
MIILQMTVVVLEILSRVAPLLFTNIGIKEQFIKLNIPYQNILQINYKIYLF